MLKNRAGAVFDRPVRQNSHPHQPNCLKNVGFFRSFPWTVFPPQGGRNGVMVEQSARGPSRGPTPVLRWELG